MVLALWRARGGGLGAAWRWLALDDLARHIVAFKRAVYEEIVAEFRPFAAPAPGPKTAAQ